MMLAEKRDLEGKIREYEDKWENMISYSKSELYPKFTELCIDLEKHLLDSEKEHTKQVGQLREFERLMNFGDGSNPFLVREIQRKPQEVQVNKEDMELPPQILQLFEYNKLEIGKQEVCCLFDYFDPLIIREYRVTRTLDKIAFQDKVGSLVQRDTKGGLSFFREHVIQKLLIERKCNRHRFMNELMLIINVSHVLTVVRLASYSLMNQ